MKSGEMCVAHRRLMKCLEIENDIARLAYIDSEGAIRIQHAVVTAITPVRQALGVRSLWPESGDLSLLDIEREQRAAAAERKALKKKNRKARRTNKIKRNQT